jgi:hypothetical protein
MNSSSWSVSFDHVTVGDSSSYLGFFGDGGTQRKAANDITSLLSVLRGYGLIS